MNMAVIQEDTFDNQLTVDIIDSLKEKPGALLPILHDIQNSLGYIPEKIIPIIASQLNLSRADVHGVISFYHHFQNTKPAQHTIQLCRAESCQAMGSQSLENHAKQKLGINYHQKTEDGQFSLEPVYCLGNCARSPSIRVADKVYADMDAEKFDLLLKTLTH
jgi:formate dehydrogenase subunit gamma